MAPLQYIGMINYIAEFDLYKEQIPEFIVKLYHILESREYSDYICWFGEAEVLIRNGKKLQQKVLPHFFRHRHLSSFVRQLNMYKFNKVNKLTKQKNHMYFKNEYFKRGQIQEMTKIKRNSKKKAREEEMAEADNNDSEISINRQLQLNNLQQYKEYVRSVARDITETLRKIENARPDIKAELEQPLALCQGLLEGQEGQEQQQEMMMQINPQLGFSMPIEDSIQNKNMLSTMRLLPRLESLIFPSQCSFYHIN